MNFAWPQLLWLLALPAAGLTWDLLRRRSSNAQNTSQKILRGEAGAKSLQLVEPRTSKLARFRVSHPWLLLGLTCCIVALARPQWGVIEERVFDQSREIVLALDLSRSMMAQDVKPSRLDRSKLLIQALLDRLAGERIGLVIFSGTAFLQCPLSADYEILRDFLPSLNPKYLPEGGTNYTALLQTALEAFAGGNGVADRFLIILSDGEALDDQWRGQLDDLKKKGVRAICLGVGTAQGAMIPDGDGGFVKDERGAVVLSKLANATLQELASGTGGVYRDASSWIDLPRLLQDTVDAGKKGRFEEKREARRIERFQWALGPALLLLLLSWWREFPVRIRPRSILLQSPRDEDSAKGSQTASPPATTRLSALLIPALLLASAGGGLDRAEAAVAASPLPSLSPQSEPVAPANPNSAAGTPLALTVKRLASLQAPSARDWANMASDTLSWGQQLRSAQQTVPPGPIQDGLAAVDSGQRQDAGAADWKKLRDDLSALLQQPPKQDQQDNQNQDQNKPQSDDRKKNDQEKKDSQSKDSKQKSDSGQSQEDSQKQQQQKQQQEDKPEDQKKSDGAKQNEQSQKDSAFGDMQQPPQKNNSQQKQAPQEMQKVGGQDKKDSTDQVDPSLTLPLQKLEKIKEQDSPARLFQILEGQKKKGAPADPGRNW